jgi:hypothetical protein
MEIDPLKNEADLVNIEGEGHYMMKEVHMTSSADPHFQ